MGKILHMLFIGSLLICSACALDVDRPIRAVVLASNLSKGCHQHTSMCNEYNQCVYYKVNSDRSIKKDDITAYSIELSGQLSEKSKNSRIQKWINYCAAKYNIKQ
ncbi:hypothetical protein N5853_01765 [Bartonella sp. HY329]|uniref:hypothetical protein n=1 Tax=unclassified Bartonella TaxID=2645622 RepID=UPI0021C67CB0|nr:MULTISPECIES: hypothetical protein [unclassified Bartonella]UXM95396.1 hypothetical protein N5853_01765 [Bartonella sp. HY329]UXN09721.1 hypothetical protein N5852_01770 [Bartonella sp. HY328]